MWSYAYESYLRWRVQSILHLIRICKWLTRFYGDRCFLLAFIWILSVWNRLCGVWADHLHHFCLLLTCLFALQPVIISLSSFLSAVCTCLHDFVISFSRNDPIACLFLWLFFFLLCWPAEEFLLNRLPFGKSNGIRILNSQFLLFPSKKQRHTHTIYNADKLNTLSSNNSSVYGNTLCLCTTLTISLLLLLLLLGCRLFYK